MSIYVDTNVFVYASSNTGEIGNQAREFLKKIEEGEVECSTSSLTFSELVHILSKVSDKETAIKGGENFLALNNLRIESVNKSTCRLALEAITQYGLGPQDALHYATMKEAGMEEIISEDADFRKAKDIRKYSLKEFLKKHG